MVGINLGSVSSRGCLDEPAILPAHRDYFRSEGSDIRLSWSNMAQAFCERRGC